MGDFELPKEQVDIITRFLFLPKTINYVTKWLQIASWKRTYGWYRTPYLKHSDIEWVERKKNGH
jgi:hypothetical protein